MRFVVTLLMLVGLWAPHALADTKPMVVKHLDSAYTGAIRPYLYDVLDTLLKLTEPEFGPYRIQMYQEDLSAARAKLETEKGEVLNVLFSSGWAGELVNPSQVEAYNFAAFNDLLGLRSLIINTNNGIGKNPPTTREALLGYTAGQGYFWEDVAILRNAGIKVVEAQLFDALFPMLERKRFDYIPLSVLEIDSVVRKKQRQLASLDVLNSVQIFYPVDFKLYVSKKEPRLAKRLHLGIHKASQGALEEVFQRHYPKLAPEFKERKYLFIAKNPVLPEQENNAVIKRFLERYGDNYKLM